MPETSSVVDLVDAFEDAVEAALPKVLRERPGAERIVSVRFAGGRTGLLDLSEPRGNAWLRVLRALHDRKQPAYVEIAPRTLLITQLLQPTAQQVGGIHPLDRRGDLRVELMPSHAQHVLRRNHSRFAALLKLLRDAHEKETLLWVTETLDTHEIIDARPAPRVER